MKLFKGINMKKQIKSFMIKQEEKKLARRR